MKLIRYGQPGQEKPGLLDSQGTLRDLSMLLPDIGPAQLNPRTLSALAAIDASRLPAVYGPPRLGSPVAQAGDIEGRLERVALGSSNLRLVLDKVVGRSAELKNGEKPASASTAHR